MTIPFIQPGAQVGGMAAVRRAEGIGAAFGNLPATGGMLLWRGTLLTAC